MPTRINDPKDREPNPPSPIFYRPSETDEVQESLQQTLQGEKTPGPDLPAPAEYSGSRSEYGEGYPVGFYGPDLSPLYGVASGSHTAPVPTQEISDDCIRENICEGFRHSGEIEDQDIQIEVKNGEVILAGTVRTQRMVNLAEDIALNLSGVAAVDNQLRAVTPEL